MSQTTAKTLRLLLLFSLLIPLAWSAPPPPLTTLQPGGFRNISQALDVNIVFIGYEPGAGPRDVNQAALLAQLPTTYRPIHRYADFYGIRQFIGLTFNYNYNLVYANAAYEDAFFAYLSLIASPQPLTLYQNKYNAQLVPPRTLTVNQNYWIDAPSVERWLATNTLPMLGVDTTKYTIFFINWYGRGDFKFHVYTKTGEPDPDTGYDFGLIRSSRKLIAWGGTTPDDEETGLGSLHRIWFHDLSAGPEYSTGNWDIINADVEDIGNGLTDYRMPPIWEYGNPSPLTYRPFNNLSEDLGKIVRYVAIDMLFTSSPLYKPAISPPKLPANVQVDLNVYQGEPGVDAKNFLKPALITQELGELLPQSTVSTQISDVAFSGRAASVYGCFVTDVSCFGSRMFRIAFADLFLYHSDLLLQFLEGDADYEVPIFAYNTPDALSAGGLLGFADDNWRDGTQSFVFAFLAPNLRSLGYGLSTTVIHEAGHHLGLSHPHDGFDYQANVDFVPDDEYYFAWVGDESNSIMSYLDLNWDFSQFDRDNMNRFMTATFINQANSVLARIYASPRVGDASALLLEADAKAAAALAAYAVMNYPGAVDNASQAYRKVIEAAAKIRVQVEPQSYQADYKAKGRSSKFIDSVNYHRNAP